MRLIILALFCLGLASCGTIISGTEQSIKINAYDPLGNPVKTAECYVRDANDITHKLTHDNNIIKVSRSRHPLNIACLDDKFRLQTYNVHSHNNTEIYNHMGYMILKPTSTLMYHVYADKTPDHIRNDITRERTDSPNFIWDYRLGIDYVDYISGAFWQYPHNIHIQFSSVKAMMKDDYSHKAISIPKGINALNL